MAMTRDFEETEPARKDIDALQGPAVIEFGTPWCGHCLAVQPLLESAFDDYPAIRHIKIEDGKGRRLGRTFQVKLWPTLVFLCDGEEKTRLVRPGDIAAIREALALIDQPACP